MSIWSDFLTNSIYSEGPSCLWQFVGIRGETCLAPRFIKVSDVASLQKGCAYKDLVKCWQCNFGTRRFYIYIYMYMSTQSHQSADCRLRMNDGWQFSSTYCAELRRIGRQISELCETGKPQSFHHIPIIPKVHSSCVGRSRSRLQCRCNR